VKKLQACMQEHKDKAITRLSLQSFVWGVFEVSVQHRRDELMRAT